MSGYLTLQADSESLATLRDHWYFLLVRIKNEPLAAALLPALVAFGPQWDAVAKEEQGLEDAMSEADAGAVAKDRILNILVDKVTVAIHNGKKVDITLPLHKLFFGNQKPFNAKLPILGAQLAMMSVWPQLLDQSSKPALKALAPEVKDGVGAGQSAEAVVNQVAAKNKQFRTEGARRDLFNDYNSVAALTYGALAAIVHDHPELKLGLDWPDSFFRHGQRSRAPKTIKQAEELMTAAEQKYLDAKSVYDDLVQKKKDADAAAAAEAEAQKLLDEANKESDAAAEKKKAAEEALKKAQKPKPKKK